MGLFSWLFGDGAKPVSPAGRPLRLCGDDTFSFEIVGESHYQPQLRAVASGSHEPDESANYRCDATLSADYLNVHDSQAVKVEIGGYTVGYIARSLAPEVRRSLAELGGDNAACNAKIVGGWDRGARGQGSYGVKLDLVWPLRRG